MIVVYFLCVLTLFNVVFAHTEAPTCDKCVKREQCEIFKYMSPTQQNVWVNKYPCMKILYKGYYIPYRNGVYVCCSDSLWAAETGYYGEDNNIVTEYTTPATTEAIPIYYPTTTTTQSVPIEPLFYPTTTFRPVTHPKPVPGIPGVTGNPGFNGGVTSEHGLNIVTAITTAAPAYCPASSFPPDPRNNCCGVEASESERVMPTSTARPEYPTLPYVLWPEKSPTVTDVPLTKNSDTTVNVTIDSRIAGGQETNFYQFPWTVQLITTFDYGQRRQSFDCGGSLISSKYVLTAGHCVYDSKGPLIKVEAYLAEYDRTTFPKDCRNVLNYGMECIENIVIDAEEVVRHPQYDDDKLFNDIALVRLQKNAPYTAFIRPICLTPINVDDTNFANLPLAVAGWGRNGRYRSNIKQSTVVNLVPQQQCKKYYPNLFINQMCAVGYSGEDTCKGDSGGPLMVLDDGVYYVVGIVSGKRADAPCGTAVPSLYTNVYQYRNWIIGNMRN